jgi:cytoskeletal protein CcmA (bactofilin family)
MWKKVEFGRPPDSGHDVAGATAPGAPGMPGAHRVHGPETEAMRQMDKDVVNIGKSVVIKGELSGSEDLVIEGTVEGKVELSEHVLTVGTHGKIKAEVFAKIVIVLGEVAGNITASEKVDIRDSGSVDGDITSPRVAIAEGAHLRGSVDMQKKPAAAPAPAPAQAAKPEVKPAPLPAGAPGPAGQRFAGA